MSRLRNIFQNEYSSKNTKLLINQEIVDRRFEIIDIMKRGDVLLDINNNDLRNQETLKSKLDYLYNYIKSKEPKKVPIKEKKVVIRKKLQNYIKINDNIKITDVRQMEKNMRLKKNLFNIDTVNDNKSARLVKNFDIKEHAQNEYNFKDKFLNYFKKRKITESQRNIDFKVYEKQKENISYIKKKNSVSIENFINRFDKKRMCLTSKNSNDEPLYNFGINAKYQEFEETKSDNFSKINDSINNKVKFDSKTDISALQISNKEKDKKIVISNLIKHEDDKNNKNNKISYNINQDIDASASANLNLNVNENLNSVEKKRNNVKSTKTIKFMTNSDLKKVKQIKIKDVDYNHSEINNNLLITEVNTADNNSNLAKYVNNLNDYINKKHILKKQNDEFQENDELKCKDLNVNLISKTNNISKISNDDFSLNMKSCLENNDLVKKYLSSKEVQRIDLEMNHNKKSSLSNLEGQDELVNNEVQTQLNDQDTDSCIKNKKVTNKLLKNKSYCITNGDYKLNSTGNYQLFKLLKKESKSIKCFSKFATTRKMISNIKLGESVFSKNNTTKDYNNVVSKLKNKSDTSKTINFYNPEKENIYKKHMDKIKLDEIKAFNPDPNELILKTENSFDKLKVNTFVKPEVVKYLKFSNNLLQPKMLKNMFLKKKYFNVPSKFDKQLKNKFLEKKNLTIFDISKSPMIEELIDLEINYNDYNTSKANNVKIMNSNFNTDINKMNNALESSNFANYLLFDIEKRVFSDFN